MSTGTDEADSLVTDFFPTDYGYKVVNSIVTEQNEQNVKFDIEIRVNVNTQEGVKLFLSQFNQSSQCTFNQQSGRPDKSESGTNPRSSYRGFRKCCLNVSHSDSKKDKQPGKNTKCEASLNFRLENPIAKFESDRKDKEMFPLWIKVHFHHNHSLSRADYFNFLAVSPDTRDMFTDMFKVGLTPSAAHAERRGMIS